MLAALEASYVDYVLIGGLAQVLRGADLITEGVDICPSFARGNLDRLNHALAELREPNARGRTRALNEELLGQRAIVRLATAAGEVGVVAAPAGVPNGFLDLRRAATREDLGSGVRPLVASSGDLAAMAAALRRGKDSERLAMLRRIVELEVAHRPPVTRPPTGDRSAARRPGRRIST